MRSRNWRIGVGAVLCVGLCLHAGVSYAQTGVTPGAFAKGYTPTDQACLQYKGASVYNSHCAGFANIEIPVITSAATAGNYSASMSVYSNGNGSVQCQAVMVSGIDETQISITAVKSSTGVGFSGSLSLGTLALSGLSYVTYFNCAVAPNAGIVNVFFAGSP